MLLHHVIEPPSFVVACLSNPIRWNHPYTTVTTDPFHALEESPQDLTGPGSSDFAGFRHFPSRLFHYRACHTRARRSDYARTANVLNKTLYTSIYVACTNQSHKHTTRKRQPRQWGGPRRISTTGQTSKSGLCFVGKKCARSPDRDCSDGFQGLAYDSLLY